MFFVRVLPESRFEPNGQRLGEITIGEFSERFTCYATNSSIDHMELEWRTQLHRLADGEPAVALVYDPRFAWVVYREGPCCFVQQQFFPASDFADIPPRVTTNEDGHRVSEWAISVSEIEHFLTA